MKKTLTDWFKYHIPHLTIMVWCIIFIVIILKSKGCHNNYGVMPITNTDSIQVWRDKYNQEHSKVEVLTSLKPSEFLEYRSNDSAIILLQATVKRLESKLIGGSSVTYVTNNTTVQASAKDSIGSYTMKGDTVYPTYHFNFDSLKNKWFYGKGFSSPDSTHIDFKVRNDYTIAIGYERPKNIFKAKKPFAEVTNLNPNTETKTMRVYQVSVPAQKRLGVGLSVGYGGYFDPARLRFGSGVYAGIGLNYNLILLK